MLKGLKLWRKELGLMVGLIGLGLFGWYFLGPFFQGLMYMSQGIAWNLWEFFGYFLTHSYATVHNADLTIFLYFDRNNTLLGLALIILGILMGMEIEEDGHPKEKRKFRFIGWDRTED